MGTEPAVVLVVGGGGREHALAWALAKSPSVRKVVVAPGNAGTALEPRVENAAVGVTEVDRLVALATSLEVDLAVIGQEDALGAGCADALASAGIPTFGPTARAARIESSKAWARGFMQRHRIPHPSFVVADSREAAEKAVLDRGGRCVLKADGLAAGKGVLVVDSVEAARTAIDRLLVRREFGTAGDTIVVEDRLEGPELSIMAISDGTRFRLLPPAQDYKRLGTGDIGPNTGGMGAYAPAPMATPELMDAIARRIVAPALSGLASEGRPFVGCLFAGLMITADGPMVIEFNARFGDPETQVQLPLVSSNLANLLAAAAAGDLTGAPLEVRTGGAVGVVLASDGYPASYPTGIPVQGLDRAASDPRLKVFHAGTRLEGATVVTSGGRVVAVTCLDSSLEAARERAYAAIGEAGVHFDGMQHRTDIAGQLLAPAV